MADKEDLQKALNELVKMSADLPPGPGRELVITEVTEASNTIEVLLSKEGTVNTDSLLASGRALRRRRVETTNGTSWCC